MVDWDGNAVVPGRIDYPSNSSGNFALPPHDHLQLKVDPDYVVLRPARADRHRRSGFLKPESFGPDVRLPAAMQPLLARVLRFGCREPVRLQMTDDTGALSGKKSQPLSDWTLEVLEEDGSVEVRLSAALYGLQPSSSKEPRSYWLLSGIRKPRITIHFAVDFMTRAAKWGSYHRCFEEAGQSTPVAEGRSSLKTARLENATIGPLDYVFARGVEGGWFGLTESRSSQATQLTLSRHSELQRWPCGLIPYTSTRHPYVHLNGFGMDVIATLLANDRGAEIDLNRGVFGDVYHPMANRGDYEAGQYFGPFTFSQVRIKLYLGPAGLDFSYKAYCENGRHRGAYDGWFEGRFLLPWEALIIRYPRLLRHRDALLAEC